MAKPLAIFRCDGGLAIGGGHVARCLTLAFGLASDGWRCAFAVSAETADTLPALGASDHVVVTLPPDNEPAHLAELFPEGCALLVVDHYRRDAAFESACRPWARHILAIDDLADRPHDCDALTDPTLGREASDYKPLVPAGAALLLGPPYALLRPDFIAARPASLERRRGLRQIERLLLSFGSTDPLDATGACLEVLAERRLDLAVDIVLGSAAPHLGRVRGQAKALPRASLHVETAQMAALMARADIAFGGAGATSWERCCLGLPTIATILADNQGSIARALEKAGAIRLAGAWSDQEKNETAVSMLDLLQAINMDDLASLSTHAASICDGTGIFRLLKALQPLRRE